MITSTAIGLEKRNGWDVGRDPRQMIRAELEQMGHRPMSPLKALRLRCLDCCADQPNEVRLCTAVTCPSWPFRMGKNPWRKQPSEAQREARRQSGIRLGRRAGNPISVIAPTSEVASAGTTLPGDASSEEIDGREHDLRLPSNALEGGVR